MDETTHEIKGNECTSITVRYARQVSNANKTVKSRIIERTIVNEKYGTMVSKEQTCFSTLGISSSTSIKLVDGYYHYHETYYANGNISRTVERTPSINDNVSYRESGYYPNGKLRYTKVSVGTHRVNVVQYRYPVLQAFKIYNSRVMQEMPSGSNLQIFDCDENKYLDWVDISKDNETQDVYLTLTDFS